MRISSFRKMAFLIAFSTTSAFAGPVTVNITDGTLNAAGATQVVQDEINSKFQVPRMADFLQSMSNRQALASKGQGVSYASEQTLFVTGGSFGLGGIKSDFSEVIDFKTNSGGIPSTGVGAVATGMLGISLSSFPLPEIGPIDPKRITLFVNFFGLTLDNVLPDTTFKTSSFGIHAQYKIIDSANFLGFGFLNWGGVAITTGFDISSISLTYNLKKTIAVPVDTSTVTWTPNSNSTLFIETSTLTIPLEISTSARILYLVSIFGGLGFDLNMGNSKIGTNINGILSSSGTVTSSNVGNAGININEEKGPSFGNLRFFVGPQFNLVPLRNTNLLSVYAQLNIATTGDYGAHAGIRIAW